MVALISEILHCFWFTIFLARGNSSGLHSSFLTIIALTPQLRKPMWVFRQLLHMSIPVLRSGTGVMTTGSGAHWPTSLVPSLLLLWKILSFLNVFQIFRGVPTEPFMCAPETGLPHGTCQFHLLVSVLWDDLCPPTLAIAAAADRK